MRLDCSILLTQAHVNKYHNPDMWYDNTAAVKAWGSLVKGTFTRDVLHSLFVILVRLSFLWILANRKLQIGLYTLYVYMWSICTLNLVKNYTTITILGAVGFFCSISMCFSDQDFPSFLSICLILFHFTHFFDRGAVLLHSWCRSTCMAVVYQDGPQLG